jgi:hypothetical protein
LFPSLPRRATVDGTGNWYRSILKSEDLCPGEATALSRTPRPGLFYHSCESLAVQSLEFRSRVEVNRTHPVKAALRSGG